MEYREINSSKPRVSYERNFVYLKSRTGQKFLAQQYPTHQSWHRVGAEALQNRQAEKAHETAQKHEEAIKAKALSVIVAHLLLRPPQVRGLTMRSNRSLRSLGRAKARPLA
jgi:hypothetical protein